jgi:CDP-paratose 2-epimerase
MTMGEMEMNGTHGGAGREVLITGGAGFIGSNLAARLLADRRTRVTIFDSLARPGVERNVAWLRTLAGPEQLLVIRDDVRNFPALVDAARGADEIYHFAAQVAVTTSVADPRNDFEVNAGGTLNVLEAARKSGRKPFLLFTSTNKVYGSLSSLRVHAGDTAYYADDPAYLGADESALLDFHSPYGCSKGAADQYVRDYARIYDLPTVVFRMSCIAGPRQFGNEDQGWVAHFLYSVLEGRTITIYGDGKQVRDILHVADLIDAMQAVRVNIDKTRGQVYNLGGGMERAVSISEMIDSIERMTGSRSRRIFAAVRPGDQPFYVADTGKLRAYTGWEPRRSIETILEDIYAFWRSRQEPVAEPVLERAEVA